MVINPLARNWTIIARVSIEETMTMTCRSLDRGIKIGDHFVADFR